MRAVAVLNRDGGTLKTTDLDAYAETLSAAFEEAGRSLECRQVAGKNLIEALEDAAADSAVELIVGGPAQSSNWLDLGDDGAFVIIQEYRHDRAGGTHA